MKGLCLKNKASKTKTKETQPTAQKSVQEPDGGLWIAWEVKVQRLAITSSEKKDEKLLVVYVRSNAKNSSVVQ